MQPTDAGPTEHAIDAAAARLAEVTRFPTFTGGVYAFSDASLARGAWFSSDGEHPLLRLAYLTVQVPRAGGDSLPLTQARCRIAIEDALSARRA